MPWLAFTWGETDQHWTASQTIVIAMIFLWGIFRLKRKWFWQKRRSRKRVGSSNEISFDLHLISLSSGDCPLSEPWDLGTGMLAADSVCAEDDPKVSNGYVVQAYYWKGTEWIRSEFPILNIFNFPPVLKQITLYRRGATNPHLRWGPERSGPCTSSPQRRLRQAVWPCNSLVGFFSSVVKIVTSRWYKVLSAQDLTREGGYGPPYAVRWFA